MRDWIKAVAIDAIEDGESYFLATGPGDSPLLWSQPLRGKERWTTKPGIAVRFSGGENLRVLLRRPTNASVVAFKVPADADKRWKKRKTKYPPTKF